MLLAAEIFFFFLADRLKAVIETTPCTGSPGKTASPVGHYAHTGYKPAAPESSGTALPHSEEQERLGEP